MQIGGSINYTYTQSVSIQFAKSESYANEYIDKGQSTTIQNESLTTTEYTDNEIYQPGHNYTENRAEPNRTEPNQNIVFWFSVSVSVFILGKFGFGARLRFWVQQNQTPKQTELQCIIFLPGVAG
jgi:hypothetical protein